MLVITMPMSVHMLYNRSFFAVQGVIFPALCFLKIMEKKATKMQVCWQTVFAYEWGLQNLLFWYNSYSIQFSLCFYSFSSSCCQVIISSCIIVLGVVGGALGTYSSVRQIIESYWYSDRAIDSKFWIARRHCLLSICVLLFKPYLS